MKSWVTVWGYGADISASSDALYVRKKGEPTAKRHLFSGMSHLLIAGNNILHTSAVLRCAEYGVPITFFDIRGRPVSAIQKPVLHHSGFSDTFPVQMYARTMIESSIESRMRYLHELSQTRENFYLKGEYDILAGARGELEYLITLPELARIFTLTKTMYYEILSRVLPLELGYKRRVEGMAPDPVNVLFSKGYAALYATIQTACIGAGLDLERSVLFGKIIPCSGHPCVREIMEPAMMSMVDRAVIDVASLPEMMSVSCHGSRWIFPDSVDTELYSRLSKSIDTDCIEDNVEAYAAALRDGKPFVYHYPA